jgi:preprotein translocase subunit SecY
MTLLQYLQRALDAIVPRSFLAVFSIPELRRKIFITLLFLLVYRVGFFIPLPFIDQQQAFQAATSASKTAFGQMLGFVSMLGGGNLSTYSIFALGIMPYISASIIFQLLASFYPPLEKLQKEGESGRKKINEYTRYATVVICVVQALLIVIGPIMNAQASSDGTSKTLYVVSASGPYNTIPYWISGVLILTAGTVFLMWLGEQIDEYGIGNGISLIIMAGIVARIPDATMGLIWDAHGKGPFYDPIKQTGEGWFKESILTLGGGSGSDISFEKLLVLILLFVAVVVGVIFITKGQRRIPTQSAKHVRGRRVYGGTRQFLPLKLNASGVMPVIFASSLLVIPAFVFNALHQASGWGWAGFLQEAFQGRRTWFYNVAEVALIFFFCYFWTAIIFNPKDMANNLKDYGSFIPGYRPGKRTAEYLERVMARITYVGAAFLAVVAIIPTLLSEWMGVDYRVASFYGGTGLLIVVSVALDLVQKINSHLVMRNYPGLTED